MLKYYFILCYLVGQFLVAQTLTRIPLHTNWKFKQVGTSVLYPASVPGTVHTDLLNNHIIPNPIYNLNESKVQWIETKDWEYVCRFSLSAQQKSTQHIQLVFEGLDTYAQVYINDTLILMNDNMFQTHHINIKPYLRNDTNELKIIFMSSVQKGKEAAKKLPYTLPEKERVFTRKAQYQYGWDWRPRLVTCGIYKNVFLEFWDHAKINDVHYKIQSLTDSLAEIAVITEIESHQKQSYNIEVLINNASIPEKYKQTIKHQHTIKLRQGITIDTFLIKIPQPQLWNCNGQGPPNYYECYVGILNQNSTHDYKLFNMALRKIEFIKESDFFGESFYFKINGKKTFMKGANIIPLDNFMSKKIDYHALVKQAKEANINMLRVWGGGLYLDDEFYTACDLNGILVWQDFMFACAMYPGDSLFLKSVSIEAEQQIKRLRNHPCLALWCGNNENDEAWNNWGWQKQFKYSKQDSTKIWCDYQKIFYDILPSAVKKHDGVTSYISSSPMIGWGRKESLVKGDSHYWGVWWGMEPFEVYNTKVGRFMSEYGFQSMPSYFTLKKYGDTLSLNSAYIKAHQKHPTGFQTINAYLKNDYIIPNNFFNYVYVSQLLQRDGIRTAIEAHRRFKPYCMGTLYWQFNDCWPVTSWSAIDYDNVPKALYFATKKLYQNVIISITPQHQNFVIYLISDSTHTINAELITQLKNTKGEILYTTSKQVHIPNNSSLIVDSLPESLIKPYSLNDTYWHCELMYRDKPLAQKNFYFVKPKDLKLYQPTIQITKTNNTILLKSDVLVKDLYLYGSDSDLKLSDNYFDLEAGVQKEIYLQEHIKNIKEIKHLSLFDILK